MRREGRSVDAHRLALPVLVLALSLAVPPLLPGAGASSPQATVAATTPSSGPVPATLLRGPVGGSTSPSFWGVIAQTNNSTGIATDPAVGGFLNATPFTWFEYTQLTEQCNITSNTLWSNSGGVVPGGCEFNVAALKAWCSSRATTCHTMLLLPGENNNSAEDANLADYIVNVVGVHPTYWAIGNEPELWKHYGIPWTQWTTSDRSTPTPLAYAIDVRNAITAVRAVLPGARFIGIEADCSCSASWVSTVAQVDGSLISAVAYHSYPSATHRLNVTAAQFYAALDGPQNISTSYAAVRAALVGQCANCSTMPILLSEYNSGPGWAPSNLSETWSNAVFLAASVTQAIRANVTLFSTFNLQSNRSTFNWSMLNATDAISPEGALYTELLPHLVLGGFRDDAVRTRLHNVWSVLTFQGALRSLLVVNANATGAIDLALGHTLQLAPGTNATVYQWDAGMSAPQVTVAPLASSYGLPSQAILLIDFTG
jgi:hypothetical protein